MKFSIYIYSDPWINGHLRQGALTPGPLISTSPRPVRNQATQQEVSGGWVTEASSVFTTTLHWSHYCWALPPVRSTAMLDSQRSMKPTVNCACERSRSHTSYENLMPGDLMWCWGNDVSVGEWLQIQIIISRLVWQHRNHNKSISCRLISNHYHWVASEN